MKKMTASLCCLGAGALLLTGCSSPVVKYDPSDFINPNRVVKQTINVPALPAPKVKATYGIGNDPLVVDAYNKYTKTGEMDTIKTAGWMTFPYSTNSKPIIDCQPLRLCVIQLESGEQLNSVNLGDTLNWKVGEFVTGKGKHSTLSVTVKPTKYDIATDLIISTDKRTYNIGLVSKRGVEPSVLRFYYPEETMIDSVLNAQMEQKQANKEDVVDSSQLSGKTVINVNHINFNYKINGDNPPWRPLRVFDDSNKTFIEMPAITSRFSLPVLYLANHKKLQMVNYRYEKPYFIIDSLVSRAWLVSGKGKDQERVEILNENLQA